MGISIGREEKKKEKEETADFDLDLISPSLPVLEAVFVSPYSVQFNVSGAFGFIAATHTHSRPSNLMASG